MQAQTQSPSGDFSRVNVVFLPGEELLQTQLRLAAEIAAGKDVRFYIDNERYFAHLSVYPLSFPTGNWESVLREVEKVARRFSPLTLRFKEFYFGERWNDVGVGFRRTPELSSAQDRIVKSLDYLREGYYPEWYDTEIAAGRLDGVRYEFVKRWGTPNIFRFWEPHLTLALFAEVHDAQKACQWLKSQRMPATHITKLAVVETDQYGTCTGIIKIFSIGK